jgi:hypothetical protein
LPPTGGPAGLDVPPPARCTGCEIRPLAALAAEPGPVTIVLLAWNYPGEFAAWMRVHREGRGDQVIHVRPDTDAVV